MPENVDMSYSQWVDLIDEWIFDETHRAMLKRSLLDGRTYEQIAEEFSVSRNTVANLIPKLQNKLFNRRNLFS